MKVIKFGSVCSGIEAASVAGRDLGIKAAWLSEIDKTASKVLAHHYQNVPNLGDMTKIVEKLQNHEIDAPPLFVGGTPCQAFTTMGSRDSMGDIRGQLSLTFCEIADEIDKIRKANKQKPCVVFWENVPGALSTSDNAFGHFLGKLAGEDLPLQPPRGGWSKSGIVSGPQRRIAWRVLNSQYFGVPQSRDRIFVIASSRKDFRPERVLFESGAFSIIRSAKKTRPTLQRIGNSMNNRLASKMQSEWPSIRDISDTVTKTAGQCLLIDHLAKRVRHPSKLELVRLQGFPDKYLDFGNFSYTQVHSLTGNSWAVPVVKFLFERIRHELENPSTDEFIDLKNLNTANYTHPSPVAKRSPIKVDKPGLFSK